MKRQPKRLLTEAARGMTFTRRSIVLGGATIGMSGLLAARMAWISIAENERYELLSESNRVQLTLIPPRRGWLVDRQGRPIAMNRSAFRVDLIPDQLRDVDSVLAQLRDLLALPPDELQRIRADLAAASGYQPVQVADGIPWEQYAAVNVRLPELPGVAPRQGFSRYYPSGAAVAHLAGYVGTPSREEYEAAGRDPLFLFPGFKVGKDGLEKSLEPRLRGEPGARRAEVKANGDLVRELETRPDVPGNVVALTIDAGLQEFAARRLGNESGAAVVLDCRNGDVLAMTSMPAFDPNSFSDGISHAEWNMHSADERVPLRNKALLGLYPPGSTFKPVTALAALAGDVDPEEVVNCPGGYRLGNRFFRCLGRHGGMNLHRAIARSCNTYFYTMARRVGIERVAWAARTLGLGEEYPIQFENQSYGTVPDPAWKMRRRDQEWTDADTLNVAIGQGALQTSPLQLAVMAARIASGRDVVPRFLPQSETPPPLAGVDQAKLALVRAGMDEVVNGAGTAGRARLPLEDVRLAGKTGTAQVVNLSAGRGGLGVPWKYRDHGLFVCFAPADNPRYAAAVVVEHGMSGGRAASPVASDSILYLYDREQAIERLAAHEESWGGDIKTRMARQEAEYRSAHGLPPVAGQPAVAPPAEESGDDAPGDAGEPAADAAPAGSAPQAAEPVAPEAPPAEVAPPAEGGAPPR